MTPLLLIPGMMCDARLFAHQTAHLGRDRAVHIAPISRHSTIEDLADDIIASAPPRFALAGLSMGGIIAMEIATRVPDRVDRLALIDTNPKAEIEEVRRNRQPQIDAVKAGALEHLIRDTIAPRYVEHAPARSDVITLAVEMARDAGAQAFVNQSLALRDRPDQQEALKKLDIPTLILCGREDRLCPIDRHELLHDLIARSTLEILEDTGHLPTIERPAETTTILGKWLES